MKNRFILLTGFVFVIAFLLAGTSGSRTDTTKGSDDSPVVQKTDTTRKTVKILIKAFKKGDTISLYMNDGVNWGINSLTTYVESGNKVKWELYSDSRIDEIIKIESDLPVGELPIIFEEEPSRIFDGKSFELQLKHIPPGVRATEKYSITFRVGDKTITIDPHLQIPPP